MQENLSLNFLKAVYAGAKTQYPPNLQELISADKNQSNPEAVRYNPMPDFLLDEMLEVASRRNAVVTPLSNNIKKRDILQYYAAFTDSHNLDFPQYILRLASYCPELAEQIEKEASIKGPLTAPEQLDIGLEITQNNLINAIGALTLTTRALARGQDSRITPDLVVNEEKMENWKRCIASFGYNEELLSKPDQAGDTYHFWEAVLAGMRNQENRDASFYNRLTAVLCDRIYLNTETITRSIRYQLYGQKGKTHSTIDTFGYHIGRALWEYIHYTSDSLNGTI